MRCTTLLILCISLILMIGCQPTPETEVRLREENIMDYSRILSDIPTSYAKEEALPDGIHLKVQAEVIKPGDELCIGTIERYSFDTATAER